MDKNKHEQSFSFKRTGAEWSKIYGITLKTLTGFDSIETYNKKHILREEYMNRAANCEIEKKIASREEILKMKKKLGETN